MKIVLNVPKKYYKVILEAVIQAITKAKKEELRRPK